MVLITNKSDRQVTEKLMKPITKTFSFFFLFAKLIDVCLAFSVFSTLGRERKGKAARQIREYSKCFHWRTPPSTNPNAVSLAHPELHR